MIDRELLRKIRRIQVVSRKRVNELLGGEYRSAFKGRGMEFDEVRAYQPGDEVRTIDWNVTARTGMPYVKQFVEEREQTLFFLVDLSASGRLASAGRSKNETAAELCALLAFSAVLNNDRVGLIAFTDRVERFIPPGKGQEHVLRIVRDLLAFEPEGRGTSIARALDYLGRMVKKQCIVFLVSDFQDRGYEKTLRLAALHYDLIAVTVTDPVEEALPRAGLVRLADAESGERACVDCASPAVRERYRAAARERQEALERLLARCGVDRIDVRTDRDYLPDIIRFFQARERRQYL